MISLIFLKMQDLEKKIIAESPVNAKVIACRFPLPNLQPQRITEEGVNTVWFYDLEKAKSTAERNA